MAFTARTRLVNPRLGTYFGIFTAAFAGAGADGADVRAAGRRRHPGASHHVRRPYRALCGDRLRLRARARPRDYFACGRRVPAFFNGLVLGVAALGGAGFLALTGSLFIIGFDAVCLAIGWYAGLVFMGVLFAPFVRKFGAYTLPTFLGRRFESRTVRIVAAATLSVPILLLLVAEARFAAYACRLAARTVRAPDGGRGRGLRHGHRHCRRHALAHLVERRQGDRRAAGAGRAGHHRRAHGLQPAAAADDAWQRAAPAHAGGDQPGRADRACPAAGVRSAARGRRATGQALHPVLRQRRQPELRSHVLRGGGRHCRLARRCCPGRARRRASTRRASRWAGRCSSPASCC